MNRVLLTVAALAGGLMVASALPAAAQNTPGATPYTPELLADGQPDITGMWNNSRAIFTPLELPEELAGKELSADELQERAQARGEGRIAGAEWKGHEENAGGVGGYGTYWFDWYWETPDDIGQASIIVDPPNGRIPAPTANARESVAMAMAELHDEAGNMESGDRCISRGVLGMMMPTEYNNGTLILQSPGYVTIHSEMIHNVRIIPIDAPHADTKVKQWEGDPRGRWEGNTLVVESRNFKAVKNMRGPTAGTRSRQSEKQHMVERFTVVGPDEIRYSVTMDDEDTYTAPWTAAFPFNRDDEYLQFEYACHEGNYSVPNALGGARQEEAGQ
jgi:hypothetical protein